MAEEDDSQKTEDPTDKKLGKARQKGQVAQSMEVKTWAVLFGGVLGLIFLAPALANRVRIDARRFIEAPDLIPMDFEHLRLDIAMLLLDLGIIMSPLIAVLVVMAVIGNVGQFGFLFASEKIKPDLSKLSLINGVKRVMGTHALVEFIKGILKLGVVALVSFGVALPLLEDVQLLPAFHIGATLDRIFELVVLLSVATVAVATVIAAIDYMYQKYTFTKQMRMSKQELKDEQKESEGDPQVKARIRKLRTERAQQRMMQAVPQADVVITNPTHYAIALEYKMEEMSAPKLVAKGIDSLAFRIREVAEANDVPIVENPPLARALYAGVELDEEIPPEHFHAVAEVIGFVMRARGQQLN